MLVLVSFGLVLLATILLVVGLLNDDGLTLIYLSIGASFTAAIVLYLAFRRAKPKADVGAEAPEPLADDIAPSPLAEDIAQARATDADSTSVIPAVAPAPAAPAPVAPAPAAAAASTSDEEWGAADTEWEDEDDLDFPIADYDDLTVAELMPLLPQLYSDELPLVIERERNGKNRSTVLKRLEELERTGTEADAAEAEAVAATEPAVVPEPVAPAAEAPAPEPEPAPAPAPAASFADEDDDDEGYLFPIADYDELSVSQIMPLLSQLEIDELEDVRAREVAGASRKTLITEIDRYLSGELEAFTWDDEDEQGAEAPAPSPAPAAASRASSSLPIAGYDDLTVAEIRPQLTDLTDAQLEAVLAHEQARDNRKTIVADIERRLESAEPAPAPAPARKKAAKKRATPARKAATKSATKSATKATKKRATKTAKKATKKRTARFPIANYDDLNVSDIRPRLTSLSDNQLEQVRERELAGAGRKTILDDIANRLG